MGRMNRFPLRWETSDKRVQIHGIGTRGTVTVDGVEVFDGAYGTAKEFADAIRETLT